MQQIMLGLILIVANFSTHAGIQLEVIEYNRDGSSIIRKNIYKIKNDSEEKIDVSVIDGWDYCMFKNMSDNESMKTANGSLVCYSKTSVAVVTSCVSSSTMMNNSSSI